MKSLEESVVLAMDGNDKAIFPYLPYILQDFWEIGSSAAVMIQLIEKHAAHYVRLHILDLGCGKGAVSIQIAEKLKCKCWGFDGISAFIEEANKLADEHGVQELCHFEVADIREKISSIPKFDVIVLGAIGQVLGDYYQTLTKIRKCMKQESLILIDDAYIEDSSSFSHPSLLKKKDILHQIYLANMKIIDEITVPQTEEKNEDFEQEFSNIQLRCNELIHQYPESKTLFEDYIQQQLNEYDTLENKVIPVTMVIKIK